MAKLNLELTGCWISLGALGADDEEGADIIARVTDADGEPVTKLTKANFKVWQLGGMNHSAEVVVFFASEITKVVSDVKLPGFYRIHIGPLTKNFRRGSFAFGVSVERKTTLKPGTRPGPGPKLPDLSIFDQGEGLVTIVRVP